MSEFQEWIAEQLGTRDFIFSPLKGDASFRSYYRVKVNMQSYVVMFAPPVKEGTESFVRIAKAWKQKGLSVPTIHGWDPVRGFVLLSDFGDTLLSDLLTDETVDSLYLRAMQTLHLVQAEEELVLPVFDEKHIHTELKIFREWFLEKFLNIKLTQAQTQLLESIASLLVTNSLTQPQVTIHRDFHSRNLMILNENADLGVIDFQDAMKGPISYDLVSLLKDCYINWPAEKVQSWVNYFANSLSAQKNISIKTAIFSTWFDWSGLQRHLKVLGIFSRLKLRDNKPNYIADMPRIMNYVFEVTRKYPDFAQFDDWLHQDIMPLLMQAWQKENISLNAVA
jgi:hypothetical protein